MFQRASFHPDFSDPERSVFFVVPPRRRCAADPAAMVAAQNSGLRIAAPWPAIAAAPSISCEVEVDAATR